MEDKKILLINDVCGYSNVATVVMIPVLSYMGVPTFNIPTALVSNNFQYGKYNILDTTEYMKGVFPVWRELGFRFRAIATGFIASETQAELVADYCVEQSRGGTSIFVDPIMADNGEMYKGLPESQVESLRRMVSVAHLAIPNYTEACYLTATPYSCSGVSLREAYQLVDGIRAIGARSVVITSMTVDGRKAVVGYNTASQEYFFFPYTELPAQFNGTGDIFSSVVYARLLNGFSLEESVQRAMHYITLLIHHCMEQEDKLRGIPIENYLHLLDT